jgi:hypothetical protein
MHSLKKLQLHVDGLDTVCFKLGKRHKNHEHGSETIEPMCKSTSLTWTANVCSKLGKSHMNHQHRSETTEI